MSALYSITKDIYDKKHQELADELQRLEIELSEHQQADYDYQTTVSTVISVARRAMEIFENCSEASEKRTFLNFLLQNPMLEGKKLEFNLASPFDVILELSQCPKWLPLLDKFRTVDWKKFKLDFEVFLDTYYGEEVFHNL